MATSLAYKSLWVKENFLCPFILLSWKCWVSQHLCCLCTTVIHIITSFQYRGKTRNCSIHTLVSFSQEFHSLRLISYRTQKAKLNLGLPKGFTDFFSSLFWYRVLCTGLVLCNFFFFFFPVMIAKKLIMTAGVVNACRCCLLLLATALCASKRRSLHLYQQIVSKSSSCFVLGFNRSGSFLSFRRV